MKFTVKQIADLLGGEIEGPGDLEIDKIAKIDEEAEEGSICFLANQKYENYIYQTNAAAVLVSKDFIPKKPVKATLIKVSDPYIAFTALLEEYQKILNQLKSQSKQGIEQPSVIGADFQAGDQVYIGAFSYIGANCRLGAHVKIYPHTYIGNNVTIDDHTIIYAGAKIYDDTLIGKHCTVHSGAVIGSEGFGFAPQADGTYKNIPQLGNVILEDYVNIGANTTVDRATIGSTLVQQGVKLDNLIQVGHNVVIGANTVMAAQSGVAGSSKIGKNCIIAGQVGIANSIQIADYTTLGAKAGVNSSIKQEKTVLIGAPAIDYKNFLKSSVIFKKLPELQKRVEELEEKIVNLTST
ncbi:MAG: UDP-3-O-(3-hydroxymyristoyl)glucosamine N-acyltransferase [Microscillaceae bacterium]|nr:UDP-3-O-(3-hydroxymyristoyl)glucosamine N-acyltransferase [Microscillaceae bacterium]